MSYSGGAMMRPLLLLLLFPVALFARDLPYWTAHADADGRIGGWREGGHVTLFSPLAQFGNNLIFGQGSMGRFKDSWTGTLGGGWRTQLMGDLGWGVNAFCDYAYSDQTNLSWVQGGIGGEVISSCFEFRANAYVPRLDRQTASIRRPFTVDLIVLPTPDHVRPVADITQATIRRQEQARWGFDFEGGAGFCVGVGSIWGYVGYYRFQGHDLQTFQGPRARGEYKLPLPLAWGEAELWIGGEYSRDRLHGRQGSVTIHVQVPLFCQRRFGRCPNMCVFKKLGDSVRRNNGIVLKRFTTKDVTHRQVGLWFIRINGPDNAPGTQTMPTSLNTVNTFSQPGDFVFVLNLLPGFQPIPIGTQLGGTPYTLKNEQTLVSFDNSSSVVLNFGQRVTLTVNDLDGAGRGGLIQNQAGVDAVIVGNNNLIQGTSIQAGVAAISGSGKSNLTVTDTQLNMFTGQGIALTNFSGQIGLTGNPIDGSGGAATRGIQLLNDGAITAAINVSSNAITKAGADGISLEISGAGGALIAVVNGNTVEDTGANGTAGIRLATNANTTKGLYVFRASNNRVTTSAKQAIVGQFRAAAGAPTVINGEISSNTITTTGTTGAIQVTPMFANSDDAVTLLINSNNFSTITGSSIVGNLATGFGTMNLTITDNIDKTATVATDTNVIDVTSNSITCLTATGNKTERPAGPPSNIIAFKVAGTFTVTNQAALSTNNNDMSVTTSGTTNTTENCPLPTGLP
jgi:Inverse autotransporter, beta-domain